MPFDVRLPDGTVVSDVPDGTTKEQLAVKLRAKGFTIHDEWMRTPSKGPSSRYVSIEPIPKGPSSRGAAGAKELMPADQLRRFATVQLPGAADAAASLGAGAAGTILGSAAALGSRAVSPMVMNAPNQMDDIARQSIVSALSRKPQTDLGQNIVSGISKAVEPVTRPVSRAIESGYQGIGQLAGPKTEMIAREAGQIVADTINALPVLYSGMKAFSAAENSAKQAALAKALQDSQKIARTPDEVASAAGFRISSFDRSHATGVPKQNVSI
ncbi:MAG: hypothetical protein ONB55_22335, partial [candidate division KSB1 bacterium]|nr:hypothetical protein [candidate division KSB1 bacterium]